MPLFKGVASKAVAAKGIDYITDPEKAELVNGINLDNSRSYARQFQETNRLFHKGRKYHERKYYHFKLSCDPADHVTPEQSQELAEQLARDLFPGHECVVATHIDTNIVNSHIIVNAVSFEDGKKLHITDGQYAGMKDLANQLGAQRGLSVLDWRKKSRDKILSTERHLQLRGGTSWKEELREVITGAIRETTNMADFEKYLNQFGVTLSRNTATTISYRHPGRLRPIRGDKLGEDYSKGAVLYGLSQQRNRLTGHAERAATSLEHGQQERLGEQLAQGSLDAVQRELRKIDETVQSIAGRTEREQRGNLSALHEASSGVDRNRREHEHQQPDIGGQHREQLDEIER